MKKRQIALPHQRRVALIVESSMVVGRQIIRGIAEYARQVNHWSVYYEPSHIQTVLPDWLENWEGDGIIARIRNQTIAKQLTKMRLPVIDLTGNVGHTTFPLVQVNNRAIAELAATHLIEHGFRSFGFCGIRRLLWSKQRQDAFEEVLTGSEYACHVHQLSSLDSKTRYTKNERSQLSRWINSLPKPIGILAANDWIGQKILEACRRVGTLVPEEVAVIGVDNDEAICEISNPMLSSIIARHDRVGFCSAELLDQLMQGKAPPTEPLTVGIPSIAVRRSTDVQTIDDQDIVAAIRFIRENACNGIHIKDVASYVALSDSTLKRRFRNILGRSIHAEIMRVRMERVRELLTETEISIAQLAQVTGFDHPEYLNAIFKAQTGMTLSQFRSQKTRA